MGRSVRVVVCAACFFIAGISASVFAQNPPATCVRTFYVDFVGGSNSNNGTSTSTPWKCSPFMNGGTDCGTLPTYTHAAGDCFVFKGGVTWTNGAFQMIITAGGTQANPDYHGVSQTYYTGGSWARPIFDMQGAVTSGDDKPVKVSGTGTSSYVTIDNIEVRNQVVPASGFANFAGISLESGNNTVTSCWLHGWKPLAGRTADGKWGGIQTDAGTTAVIDGCELGPAGTFVNPGDNGIGINAAADSNTIRNCKIHDLSNGIIGSHLVTVNNNQIYNINLSFDSATHENFLESLASTASGSSVYNNVFHTGSHGVMIQWVATGGSTDVFYNNVSYDTPVISPIQIDTNGVSPQTAVIKIFNNTLECGSGSCVIIINRGTPVLGTLVTENLHYITTSTKNPTCTSAEDATNCAAVTTWTDDHNVTMSQSTATSQGYTAGNTYQPTACSNGTVDVGVSQSSILTTDRLGVSRPQNCSSATWDVGAYEFLSNSPKPPTGLSAVVH